MLKLEVDVMVRLVTRNSSLFSSTLGSLFAFVHIAEAATLHVPADHPTIQAAIDSAANGDEVLVAPETYPVSSS